MKVRIDEDLCIGCGLCEGAVPEVFSLENGAIAEVIVDEVPEGLQSEVRATSSDCPTAAILVEADELAADSTDLPKESDNCDKTVVEATADQNEEEKGKEMKVTVDKDLCIGCGVCEGICPEVFSLANEPYAEVLLDPIPEEFQELCRQAAADCPVEAIQIEE